MRVPERNREGQAAQRRNWAGQSELTKQKQHQRIGGGGEGDRPRAVGSRSLDKQIWKSGIHVWRMCVNGQIADHWNKTVRSQES